MKIFLFHPLFYLGLLFRLVLVTYVDSQPYQEWYVPFILTTSNHPTLDPWAFWVNSGGNMDAFPYGYVMLLVFMPLLQILSFFDAPLEPVYLITLLLFDVGLLLIIEKLLDGSHRFLLVVYWLSPIVIFSTYLIGLNDLVPVFFLLLSLLFVRSYRLFWGGFFYVMAVSAKLSMIVAFPFFVIYFLNSKPIQKIVLSFVKGLMFGLILVVLPFIFSSSGLQMVLGNRDIQKIFYFSLSVGPHIDLYLVPLAYFLLMYYMWRVKRLNYDLFYSSLGFAFLLVVMLSPVSPGWLIWSIPFLVSYQVISEKITTILIFVLSSLYLLNMTLISPELFGKADVINFVNKIEIRWQIVSIVQTFLVALCIVFASRIWREAISRNDYFRLSRKPFVFGIAGESEVALGGFVSAISGLFGVHSVVNLSESSYYLWDKKKPIWQKMRHFNPSLSDLEGFAADLVSLINGKEIRQRRQYRYVEQEYTTTTIKSNDFIFANGAHALYLPILRRSFDLKIYIDVDKGFLDKSGMIELPDSSQQLPLTGRLLTEGALSEWSYITANQSKEADLVLSVKAVDRLCVDKTDGLKSHNKYKLIVTSRNELKEAELARILIGVCGLHVEINNLIQPGGLIMQIEGEVSKEDIALAINMLNPRILDFLDLQPKWLDGILGLMQLVVLSHVEHKMTTRFL